MQDITNQYQNRKRRQNDALYRCSKMSRPSSNTSISMMKRKLISDIPSSSEGENTQDENVLPGCSTRSNISVSEMNQHLIADIPSSSEGSTVDENEMVTLEPVNPSAAIKNALPRQKKTKKDVRPKRAKTSYFYFSTEERKKIKANNPNLLMTEVTKLVGQQWKTVSGEEKDKYQELAKMDRARYELEVKEFIDGGGSMPKSKLTKQAPKISGAKTVPIELLPYQNLGNDNEGGKNSYDFAGVEKWDDAKWTFFKEEKFENSKYFYNLTDKINNKNKLTPIHRCKKLIY